MFKELLKATIAVAVALLDVGCVTSGASQNLPAGSMPSVISVPVGHQAARTVSANGDQIYVCKRNDKGGFNWTLKGPEAVLTNANGLPFGHHYAGPTWEAYDGSKVTATLVAKVSSPSPDNVPWLLLRATSNSGDGVLSHVSFIQRIDTSGGNAPMGGCDDAHAGAEARAAYSARYVFFAPTVSR